MSFKDIFKDKKVILAIVIMLLGIVTFIYDKYSESKKLENNYGSYFRVSSTSEVISKINRDMFDYTKKSNMKIEDYLRELSLSFIKSYTSVMSISSDSMVIIKDLSSRELLSINASIISNYKNDICISDSYFMEVFNNYFGNINIDLSDYNIKNFYCFDKTYLNNNYEFKFDEYKLKDNVYYFYFFEENEEETYAVKLVKSKDNNYFIIGLEKY